MIYTTLSSKGQLVIPKHIRNSVRLKPSDKLRVKIERGKITLEPVLQVSDAFGMFKTPSLITKKKLKDVVKKQRAKKFDLS